MDNKTYIKNLIDNRPEDFEAFLNAIASAAYNSGLGLDAGEDIPEFSGWLDQPLDTDWFEVE